MRQAMSIAPALIVTLALFFLMQLMIAGGRRDIERVEVQGGVGLVTLRRAPMTGETAVQPSLPRPEQPAPSSAPPSPPDLGDLALPPPDQPDLRAELSVPEMPAIEALPFLGGPPVVAAEKATPPAKSKKLKKAKKKVKKKKTGSRTAKRSEQKTPDAPASPMAGKRGGGRKGGAGRGAASASGSRGSGGSGDRGLVVLSRPKPSYPRKAVQRRQEGWVKVAFTVTKSGTVTGAKVVTAKPKRVFDRSAVAAIRRWRFKPKMVAGKPVQTRATQLIRFNLANR